MPGEGADLAGLPAAPRYRAFIDPDNGTNVTVTVTGSQSARSIVRSLVVGQVGGGQGTLNVAASSTLTLDDGATITSNGHLTGSGGTIADTLTFDSGGTFDATVTQTSASSVVVTDDVTLAGNWTLSFPVACCRKRVAGRYVIR